MPLIFDHEMSSEEYRAWIAKGGDKVDLIEVFKHHLHTLTHQLPPPEYEWPFNQPLTKHRFDVAWPKYMVAVELHGGVFTGGRHVRPVGFTNDRIKMNLGELLGWRVLEFTAGMMEDDTLGMIKQIEALLVMQTQPHEPT